MNICEQIQNGLTEIATKKEEITNISHKITNLLDDIYIQDVVIRNNKLLFAVTTFYSTDPYNMKCLTTTLVTEVTKEGLIKSYGDISNGTIESDIALEMLNKNKRELDYNNSRNQFPILACNYSDISKENLKDFINRTGADLIENFDKIVSDSTSSIFKLSAQSLDDTFKKELLDKISTGLMNFSEFLSLDNPDKTKDIFLKSGINFYQPPFDSLESKKIKALAMKLEESLSDLNNVKPKMKI